MRASRFLQERPENENGSSHDPLSALGLSGGWFRVPNIVVEKIADIGITPFAVYCVLSYHADRTGLAFPSLKRITKLCKAGRSSVLRALDVLSKAGWIRIERGCKEHGGREVNRYHLPPHEPSVTTGLGHPLGGITTGPPLVSPQDQGGTTTGPEQDSFNKTHSNKTSSRPKLRFDEGDLATAGWMFKKILEIAPKAKAPNLEKWANVVRLIRKTDGHNDEEIRKVFAWANRDSFWRSNILSPDKLREKFTTLTLRMEGESNGHAQGRPRQSGGAGKWQRYQEDGVP